VAQLAYGMAEVEQEVIDERQTPDVGGALFDVGDIAELAPRPRDRFVARHAAGDERVDFLVEVRLQLVLQLAPHAVAAEDAEKPAHDSPRARTR
jgi:hypothetical protein